MSTTTRTSITKIRRHELEKATFETADEIGIRYLTIEKIARHAGVSKGVVHHYFQSKDDIIVASVRYANRLFAHEFLTALSRDVSPSGRLSAAIGLQFLDEFLTAIYQRNYLDVVEAGFRNEEVRRVYDAGERRGRSNLAHALRQMVELDEAREDAFIIWSMIEGAWLLLPGWPQINRNQILQAITEFLKARVPGFDPAFIDQTQDLVTRKEVPAGHKSAISTIRRMELEKAALDILYERGFRELTVQRVAEKAQLSKGMVHHYFLNKDDLIAGALRHELREFRLAVTGLLRKTGTASERLWTIIVAELGEQYLQFNYLRWYVNSLEAGFRNQGILRIYQITELRGRSNITFALKQLMSPAEARRTAWTLWSMIEGAYFLLLSDRTITRKDVLLGIARYLTSSIPSFDSSVIDGMRTRRQFDRSLQPRTSKAIELENIHEATIDLVGHVGYRKLTFELLAEHMGVTTKAIRRHHRSIGDLTIATVNHALAEIEEIGERRNMQANSASEALWSLIYADVEPGTMTRQRSNYLQVVDAGLREPRILEVYTAVDNRRRTALAGVLKKLIDPDDAEVILDNLWTMIEGAWGLLPSDPGTAQIAIIEAISSYLVRSVPGFDPSVLKLSTQWNEETGARPDQ